MGYLLFLVFLTLWIVSISQGNKRAKENYRRGFGAGYEDMRGRVWWLFKNGKVSTQDIKDLIGMTPENERSTYDENSLDSTSADSTNQFIQQDTEAGELSTQESSNQTLIGSDVTNNSYTEDSSAMPVTSVYIPQPELTQEQIEQEKAKRTVNNLNLLLYVGSFLIIAAVAVFVTLTMPAMIKLIGLIVMTVVFYVSGLFLYDRVPHLRSASVAFVGTGLAILPFVGFALNSLGGLSGSISWFLTSIVGLLAYGVSAMKLKSQFVSYLTVAFVISLALSAVSSLSLSVVWYFVTIVGLSAIFNSIHYLKPALVPKLFHQPVEQAGIVIAPIGIIASLLFFDSMTISMYEVLFGVSAAHYIIVWLEKRTLIFEIATRVLLHITLATITFDIFDQSEQAMNYVIPIWIGLLFLQQIYSLVRVNPKDKLSRIYETVFLWLIVVVLAVHLPLLAVIDHTAWWLLAVLPIMVASGIVALFRFRQIAWAYLCLAVSFGLPFVLKTVVDQVWFNYQTVALIFTVVTIGLMYLGYRVFRRYPGSRSEAFLRTASYLYMTTIVLIGVSVESTLAISWSLSVVAILLVAFSHIRRLIVPEGVGVWLFVFSIFFWMSVLRVASEYVNFSGVLFALFILIVGAVVYHLLADERRRNLYAISASIMGFSLVGVNDFGNLGHSNIQITSMAILTVATGLALAYRSLFRNKSLLSRLALVVYYVYPISIIIITSGLGLIWGILASVTLCVVFWVSSYLEKVPWLLIGSNLVLIMIINSGWDFYGLDFDWQFHGVSWILAAVYYLTYWVAVRERSLPRQMISLISTWVVLGVSAVSYIFSNRKEYVIASVVSLVLLSGTMALAGYMAKKRSLIESSVYIATFAVQRLVQTAFPEINLVAYGHMWAVVIALVGYKLSPKKALRYIVAMAFATGSIGLYALGNHAGYSVAFLIEHVVFLIIGVVLARRWIIWWGIVSVTLAVLYFIRGYTFLVLLLLGSLLIAFVVWRLMRMNKKSVHQSDNKLVEQTGQLDQKDSDASNE